jgi:hypothetical protein
MYCGAKLEPPVHASPVLLSGMTPPTLGAIVVYGGRKTLAGVPALKGAVVGVLMADLGGGGGGTGVLVVDQWRRMKRRA